MSLLDVQADNVISRNRGDDAIYEMDVYVRDTNHVNRLILDLEKLPYILKGRKDYQIMRVLVQKCRNASVSVSGKIVGRCDFGLMLLVGFTEGDDSSNISYLVNKVLKLRIFEDENGVMNRSVMDVDGSIFIGFSIYFIRRYEQRKSTELHQSIEWRTGKRIVWFLQPRTIEIYFRSDREFGADMEVSFTNLGPTTILLERWYRVKGSIEL